MNIKQSSCAVDTDPFHFKSSSYSTDVLVPTKCPSLSIYNPKIVEIKD